jgi:NAD-dependent dihydropyrimidine dehydrogenase PreA subunit
MSAYIKNVVTLELNREACTGCGMCTAVCPQEVFVLEDGKATYRDRDACMECGACMKNCPADAIYVKSGVGCASGIINGMIRGTEPTCGCDDNGGSGCC